MPSPRIQAYQDAALKIATNIRTGTCAFFIGAGVSFEAGLPSWDELTATLVDELGLGTTRADALTVAEAFAQRKTRARLEEILFERFDCEQRRPTLLHERLARFPVDAWITTNFDTLLERALECAPEHVIVEDSDYPKFRPTNRWVLKLHGDITSRPSMVITKSDFAQWALASPAKYHHISHLFSHRSFVFIGYSLRDPDFERVTIEMSQRIGSDKLRSSYAVLFGADPLVRIDLLSRGVEVIDLGPLRRDERTAALFEFLDAVDSMLVFVSAAGLEVHQGQPGLALVPFEVRPDLSVWRFVCCLERVLYNQFDDYPIQQESDIPIPLEFLTDRFRIIRYERQSRSGGTKWDGVAVWRAQDWP